MGTMILTATMWATVMEDSKPVRVQALPAGTELWFVKEFAGQWFFTALLARNNDEDLTLLCVANSKPV